MCRCRTRKHVILNMQMKTLSRIWNGFLNIFGFRKKSKYVKNYLNEANMRSAIFMSSVIFILEIWLVIRQSDKYVIPTLTSSGNTTPWFQVIFTNTSLYFLMMFFGLAMLVYSAQYVSQRKSRRKMIISIVAAGLSIILCCLLPLEFKYGSINLADPSKAKVIRGVLRLLFYVAVFLFDVGIIFANIYRYKGGKNANLGSVMIISLFALVCLMFGVMVSYGDFISSKIYTDVQIGTDKEGNPVLADVLLNDDRNKQIICFLMFSIYIGCLLIWNPLISIGILGTLFLGFYFAINNVANFGSRVVPEGDKINYITFFISLTMVCISIYNQRISEATKDEELEELATKDKISGLLSFEYFAILARDKMHQDDLGNGKGAYLFLNLSGFKIYNDQKGFERGNVFLKETGQIICEVFPNSLVSRQSDDHFVVFTKNEGLEEKIKKINEMLETTDPDVRLGMKAGIYITTNPDERVRICVERARYAYGNLKQLVGNHMFDYYDQEMHDNYLMAQYIVTHIDEAIKNGYLKAYYQPVVWSKGRTLCGVEALARWIDPKYGFLSPGKFVPVLESSQLIYKLDKEILRLVCQDIRHNLDNNLPVLPVSINFSRADFGVIDIVQVVEETVEQYDIPHDLLHIEITESALTDEEDTLKNTINHLHEKGFATWLDDFGSGYSSFNVLKDYEFDVLKLDMKFLTGFNGNEKAKALIKSVISMAEQIGMKTLCEGVETSEQAAFLEEASCGRLQGYLYGKPLTYEDLMGRIKSGEYNLAKELLKK